LDDEGTFHRDAEYPITVGAEVNFLRDINIVAGVYLLNVILDITLNFLIAELEHVDITSSSACDDVVVSELQALNVIHAVTHDGFVRFYLLLVGELIGELLVDEVVENTLHLQLAELRALSLLLWVLESPQRHFAIDSSTHEVLRSMSRDTEAEDWFVVVPDYSLDDLEVTPDVQVPIVTRGDHNRLVHEYDSEESDCELRLFPMLLNVWVLELELLEDE
jgi:hypothetical protein